MQREGVMDPRNEITFVEDSEMEDVIESELQSPV